MAANTSGSVDNDVPIQRDKFVCIEYPGRVENVQKMLGTLGNEETISATIGETNKKIELRFRPDDPYCKPVCGTMFPTNNLLVRVKRRYRRPKTTDGREEKMEGAQASGETTSESSDELKDVEFKSEILGIVEDTFRFTGMCDFQYLPIDKNKKDGKLEPLIDKIIPSNIGDPTKYLDQDVPYHLQPPSFSRTDLPSDYNYKPDQIQHRPNYPPVIADTLESNLIGRSRARRPHNAHIVGYNQKYVPPEPHPNAVKVSERYQNQDDKLVELKSNFDKRPMWSKNALKCNITLTDHQFKVLLPLVAYYFISGPWRAIWCRLGYDPRKTPADKQYQMLDFRLRKVMSEVYGKGVIRPKRSTYMYRLPITVRRQPLHEAVTVGPKTDVETRDILSKDAYYIFRRGLVPAYHQMFYQLCDIHIDELQTLIHSNDGKENKCCEKNGWLEPDVLATLRDLITEILKETLINIRKENENAEAIEDQPSTSEPQDDKDEDDDDDDGDDEDDDGLGQDGDDDDGIDEPDEDDDINEMEMEILEYMDTGDT